MTAMVARGIGIRGRLAACDVDARAGQCLALVGPNGGGKTSLLRALAGVEEAVGTVSIDGQPIAGQSEARRRRLLSFLPASRDIGWPIAAADVIALGLAKRDEVRIAELVDLFELGALGTRPIDQLSTGERGRVLMARALAARPRLLLLDEPFANLEPYWVLRLGEILRLAATEGSVVIVALHDLERLGAFDRALLVAGGMVEMDEAPASLMASERFETIFRIAATPGGWAIRPADRQSSR